MNGHGASTAPPGRCLDGCAGWLRLLLLLPPSGPGTLPATDFISSAGGGGVALAVVCPAPMGVGLRFWLAPLETEKKEEARVAAETGGQEAVEC